MVTGEEDEGKQSYRKEDGDIEINNALCVRRCGPNSVRL